MPLAKLTMLKNSCTFSIKILFPVLFTFCGLVVFAQDNSPYSRFGLGDVMPNTNIISRGMGSITAGYADFLSVNSNNPASYSAFRSYLEERSKRFVSGRVILDAGLNIENRTLRNPNQPEKFTAPNALFSYLHVGIPLRNNWGMSFGLKPLSRINYKIARTEQLFDPRTGKPIDSAYTEFTGNGGSYLPGIGTGFAIKNFSAGVNIGYLFGKRENTTKRAFLNDTVLYNNSNHTTRSSYGGVFLTAGAQYKINLNKETYLRLGANGNLKRNINGTQVILRETFIRDASNGDFQLDSVYEQRDVKGEVVYPASYTLGFIVEHQNEKLGGWLIGADFIQNNWDDFRFFGTSDSVKDNWQLRVGGQFRPQPGSVYFSNVAYRAGFFTGPDYINIRGKLPQYGVSFGLGLPVANYNRLSQGQFTVINLALEYSKRGNNDNLLKENMFRISLGLNFSDIWFNKRKYD
ncbi:MAG: hypothetical protein ABR502_06045 [Chitinophagaceae bacterium]